MNRIIPIIKNCPEIFILPDNFFAMMFSDKIFISGIKNVLIFLRGCFFKGFALNQDQLEFGKIIDPAVDIFP